MKKILNHSLSTPIESEYALYYMISIIFSKRFHCFEHDFDGIAHTLEINEHLHAVKKFGQMEFKSNNVKRHESQAFNS